MTIYALALPQRRGACPGLSAPMPTGDGLLVRFLPTEIMSPAAFTGLCKAARVYGNGVIEVTSRGSIQLRGLSETTAPLLAATVAALDIAADDGLPIHCDPLSTLATSAVFDANQLAANLRSTLTPWATTHELSPKVSIAIDGGGPIVLAKLSADIRFEARTSIGGATLRVSIGGDETTAIALGHVLPGRAAETAMRLLGVVSQRGREARARNIITTEGAAVFRSAIGDLLTSEPSQQGAPRIAEAIGQHSLRDGSWAHGVGFAFGHADSRSLEKLVEAAAAAGATGMRPAVDRTLYIIGLRTEAATVFGTEAERLGFIVRADDPRRRVVACAGAPICAAAHIGSRALAPLVAELAAGNPSDAGMIHVSGCAKGCARAAAAALTVVGTPGGCALIADGTAHDTPFAVVPTDKLPAAITEYMRQRHHEPAHV